MRLSKMDHRLLLPWILMLVLDNLADGALTWNPRPPSLTVDLTTTNPPTNPCQNSIYTFSVDNAENSPTYSFTQNPDGRFTMNEDKLYCTEATLKTNGYSSYNLTVTITDGTTTLTDTFTVTVIGLPTTTTQTTTASTTPATAASTTQTSTASTTQVTASSTTQTSTASTTQVTTVSTTQTTTFSTSNTVKPACGNLSWDGLPPSQRFPSVNFSSTQPNPCKDSIYTFSVCGARDQLKIRLTQNPNGQFTIGHDKLYCSYATLKINYEQSGSSNYTLSVTITDGTTDLTDTFTLGLTNINSEAGGMIVSMVTLIGCLLISKLE